MQSSHPVFDGTSNLRDLGGMPAGAGSRVRRGHVYRSAHLDDLTAEGRRALREAGINLIVDFRGVDEAARAQADTARDRLHVPIEPTIVGELQAMLETGDATSESVHRVMEGAYRRFVIEQAETYRRYFSRLLEPDAFGFLIHCTAGKDRTGIGIALLLSLLGTDYTDIERDYLLSNSMLRRDPSATSALPQALVDVLYGVDARYLAAAFAAIREAYGDTDRYLGEAMGLGPEERRYLREELTEPV